jgi:methylmalonyl-CoA/ethylmalonyl-CoA epimerase
MIKRIDHIAIIVPDLETGIGFWAEALGLPVERIEAVPDEAVEVAFLPVGESEVELLRPTDEQSGVARFLEKTRPRPAPYLF